MSDYLDRLAEEERLAREAEERAVRAQGGSILAQLAREEFKTKRRGEEPEMPESFGEFAIDQLKAAPESAAGFAGDVINALWNPWDTAKAVGGAISSGLQKGTRRYAENIAGRELPREGEEEFDAVLDYYSDKYGTIPRAVNTLKEDPFGTMADLSPAGLLKRGKAPPVDPLGVAGKTVQEGLTATNIPTSLYRRGAGINPSLVEKGDVIAADAMRLGIGTSRSGIKHIDRIKKSIGEQIDAIVKDATDRGVKIPKESLNKYLDAMIQENSLVFDKGDLRTLERIRNDFADQFRNIDELTPEQVQKWKVARYEKAYAGQASPEPTIAKGAATKGQRQQGRGARRALEKEMPELQRLNEDWGSAAQMRPFLANRVDAIARQDPSLGKLVRQTIAHPKFQGRIAIGLDRIARGDLGWVERNFNTHEIRTLLALAGRTEELMEMEGLPR
jgi:hypothetical protein